METSRSEFLTKLKDYECEKFELGAGIILPNFEPTGLMRVMRFIEFQNEAAFLQEVESLTTSHVKNDASDIESYDRFPTDFFKKFAAHRLFALEKLTESGPCLNLQSKCNLILRAIGQLSLVSASAAKVVLDQNLGQHKNV